MITNNQFTAIYKKTRNWFVAWIEEIPGINTQGKTLKEARDNLQDALLMTLEANREVSRTQLKKSDSTRRELIKVTLPA